MQPEIWIRAANWGGNQLYKISKGGFRENWQDKIPEYPHMFVVWPLDHGDHFHRIHADVDLADFRCLSQLQKDIDQFLKNSITTLQFFLWTSWFCKLPKSCSVRACLLGPHLSRWRRHHHIQRFAGLLKSVHAVNQLGGRLVRWVKLRCLLVIWPGNPKSPYHIQ